MIIQSLQEFYNFCIIGNAPILGIDYGAKKIGLAISDPRYTISMPLSIIFAHKEEEKLQQIAEVIKEHSACAIVIGLPINMDSSYSAQTKTVINFANKIVTRMSLPVYLQDERLTSKAANNLLKNMGLNRKKRNKIDDMSSASMILETTLKSIKNL